MAMGTPEYMSPEQAAGRSANERCDIYALGAILYEMVTGIPPYSGDNFMEILTKKATVDPPPPALVRSELPIQVSDLVVAAMARNPDDRPQSMEALEYELNKCLAGRGVAVAQILGMTTDAHVVATLNSGLAMRSLDDAAVVSRPQTSSPAVGLPRANTLSGASELPAMWSGPAMTTGQNALQSSLMMRRDSEPAAGGGLGAGAPLRAQTSPSQRNPGSSAPSMPAAAAPVMLPRRSMLGVFGWLVLAAVLFGGVGSLLYIALGERAAASRGSEAAALAAGSSRGAEARTAPTATPAPAPTAVVDAAASGSAAASAGGAGSDDAQAGRGKADDKLHKHPPPRVATAKRPQQSENDGDFRAPAALVKQAKAFERTGQWDEARAAYQRLEKIKGFRNEALYRQAWAAFQSNDTAGAATLAGQVATEAGPFQVQAKFLYADALYRQAEYDRAKELYKLLRTQLHGDDRATATKKIVACNKALKLPDGDGIHD